MTALVPESEFFRNPRNPGDPVGLTWDDVDLHALQTTEPSKEIHA